MSSSSALLSISGVNSSIISNAPVVAPEEHNKTIEETKQDDNHQSDPNEEDIWQAASDVDNLGKSWL